MILLELDGIPGDSNIKAYEKWIACTSCSWNIERTFSESGKAGTQDVNVGVSEVPPITLGKTFDTASVFLMQNSIAGGSLGSKARIHFVSTAGTSGSVGLFLSFTLFNPIVASWSISGEEDGRPTEEITLWYWKIYCEYFTSNDGKNYKFFAGKGWDRVKSESWDGKS